MQDFHNRRFVSDKHTEMRGKGRRKVWNIKFNGRRCERRLLPPVLKRTTLVIFFKPAFEFGFFILKVLFPYKTPLDQYREYC